MSDEEKAGPASSEYDTSVAKSAPAEQTEIVDFDGENDPYNPLNWPFKKKFVVTMLYSFCTMGATFASTVFVPPGCCWACGN
jgi:hypothetical protein